MTQPQPPIPVTVRELARRIIDANVPALTGRVYEQRMAGTPQEIAGQPFAIVTFSPEQVVNTWGARAWPMVVTVEIPRSYSDPTYRVLDQINAQIVAAFAQHPVLDEAASLGMAQASGVVGDLGSRYVVDFTGAVGADTVDEGYDALIHPIQFSLAALNTRPEDQHMVLAALRHWTVQVFPQAQVNTLQFNPNDVTPSIGYRIERGELVSEVLTDEVRFVDMLVSVHVITPDHMVRSRWTQDIAAALRDGMSARGALLALPTSMAPETYAATLDDSPKLTVNVSRNNPMADAFTDGQLTLTARWLDVDVDELTVPGPVITEVILDAPIKAQAGPVS